MKQQVNFYQPEFRESAVQFPASLLVQVTAAVFVTMAFLWAYGSYRVSGVQQELEVIAQQEQAAVTRLENLRTTISDVVGETSWAQRLEEASDELSEKEASLRLISGTELGDAEGFARHLKALARQSTDGLWLTNIALAARNDRVWLQGEALRAELVPTYLQDLGDEEPFESQRFARLEIDNPDDDGTETVSFVVSSVDSLESAEGIYR